MFDRRASSQSFSRDEPAGFGHSPPGVQPHRRPCSSFAGASRAGRFQGLASMLAHASSTKFMFILNRLFCLKSILKF
jgi:hypothetical protein